MNELTKYKEFLRSKTLTAPAVGFEVDESSLHSSLFDFQRWIVKVALQKGRYAIFADCGLGKTLMQLVWADAVSKHTDRPILILAPLNVVGQTLAEADKFNIAAARYDGFSPDVNIYVTNYESLEHISVRDFGGIVLDESSILKNYTGVYRNRLIETFAETEYKLACTATPSPNDIMELGNHAEFLGLYNRSEMLARWFYHDGGETAKWTLKGHAEVEFYSWLASWSVMLSKPSDIGFSASGYNLPDLIFHDEQIVTQIRDNGKLFNDTAVSATSFNEELRITLVERIERVADIVNSTDEDFIIWVNQDIEADKVKSIVPDAVEVRGSESPKAKEEKLLGFQKQAFRVLLTKTKMARFGLNYQHCHNQIFAALDFSFESLYQAIRRSYRFGQQHPVHIYLVTTDTMQNVIEAIERKQKQHVEMQRKMIESMNSSIEFSDDTATSGIDRVTNEHCDIRRGDCVELIRTLPDESVGFSIFSPPFASLYTYSDHPADMGNCSTYEDFAYSFRLLVEELYRVMWSGRNVAVHCMDLPIQKGKEGYIGLRDFSGLIRETFEAAGFIYHSRVTIWKNPVTEMQRTKALGLLHKQVKKDAAMSRTGIPDYLMVFRKPGEHLHPVRCEIDVDTWQQYASPVWMDINYGNTLNVQEAREEKDERHICPLQLDTISRSIHLWTNEGDTVLTPFMGIGSEVFQAIKQNRIGIGFELKDSYFQVAIKNVQAAIAGRNQMTLFEAAA